MNDVIRETSLQLILYEKRDPEINDMLCNRVASKRVNVIPDPAITCFLSLRLLHAFPATHCSSQNPRETNIWNIDSLAIQVSRSAFYRWEHGSRLVSHCTFFPSHSYLLPLDVSIGSFSHV